MFADHVKIVSRSDLFLGEKKESYATMCSEDHKKTLTGEFQHFTITSKKLSTSDRRWFRRPLSWMLRVGHRYRYACVFHTIPSSKTTFCRSFVVILLWINYCR